MIWVDNGKFKCARPEEVTPAVETECVVAYTCPECDLPVYGLMRMKGRQMKSVPKEFRLEKSDPSQLHLKAFYPSKYGNYEPPEFESHILRTSDGSVGQVFWEKKHWGSFESNHFPNCAVTRIVRAKQENDAAAVYSILAGAFNVPATTWETVYQGIKAYPEIREFAWKKIAGRVRIVNDLGERKPPIYLLSRNDFYYQDVLNKMSEVCAAVKNTEPWKENQ